MCSIRFPISHRSLLFENRYTVVTISRVIGKAYFFLIIRFMSFDTAFISPVFSCFITFFILSFLRFVFEIINSSSLTII